MPAFKDEHVLIIVPGSHTTLAQLGIPESLTPASFRMRSCMFPAEVKGQWEPHKVIKRVTESTTQSNGTSKDIEMKDAEEAINQEPGTGEKPSEGNAEDPPQAPTSKTGDEQKVDEKGDETKQESSVIYEEDITSDEGAVYPIQQGRIVNWPCFFALLSHVYTSLSPPFHTPVLLVAEPAWTLRDHEMITQFIFEKFKPPGFCLIDSALAACYAYGVSHATVVDVGYQKTDVTAVADFLVNDLGREIAHIGCGGDAMTEQLFKLLGPKGFTKDMCEQLKCSNICEILPPGTPLPGQAQKKDEVTNPAAAASTGALGSGPGQRQSLAAQGSAPRGPGADTDVEGDKDVHEDEGVLDVASIVASGKTSEFLARKEREKAEKAAAKTKSDAAGPKQARLRNSEKEKTVFTFEERVSLDELKEHETPNLANSTANEAGSEQQKPDSTQEKPATDPLAINEETSAPAKPENPETQSSSASSTIIRKDIEVGTERFLAASGDILETIADVIHRVVLSVPDLGKRAELWDSLIILGNGSKVRGREIPYLINALCGLIYVLVLIGFTPALLHILNTKYLVSPSSATIFTSELPSNLSTPAATGANTPNPREGGNSSHGHGVNPLLLAATTASHPGLVSSTSNFRDSSHFSDNGISGHPHHSGHGQTPTSIKIAKIPEYFPEWKEAGFEEAVFLGAQVAAKVVYVVDQGASKGYMARAEYNELGPQGIHESTL
ncbi:MAG: Actin-like protein arp9 (SWI/SNF complex component arp9) [Cirrosporium novae-zelandiae]|nr:MAG: Actin-like protein arp9 (SWI/SNF complex component arp9) [Cirrosporium novae-zelandiae]